MKRVLLFLVGVFISAIAFSQDVVQLGDKLLTSDNMEKARSILTNGGMVIEPVEELFGIDPDTRITASNGTNPKIPIMCTVYAESKQDSRISLIQFVYNGDATNLETQLRKLGYTFLNKGKYKDGGFTFSGSRYQKGNKYCLVSYPTNGGKGALLDFMHNRK